VLEIRENGTVSRFRPGPADARVREDGTWEARADGTVLLRWQGAAGQETLELTEAGGSELRFRSGPVDAPDDGGDGD
jgi:hypothetical protein